MFLTKSQPSEYILKFRYFQPQHFYRKDSYKEKEGTPIKQSFDLR